VSRTLDRESDKLGWTLHCYLYKYVFANTESWMGNTAQLEYKTLHRKAGYTF